MSWQPEVDEIKRRIELAKQMGGEANVARQHANGRLTVRERIERLLDPESFHETGALAGKAAYINGELIEFLPANFVFGTGRVDERQGPASPRPQTRERAFTRNSSTPARTSSICTP